MTEKKKGSGAIRQAELRQRRHARGYIRKEYWATLKEHGALSKHLTEIRKK